MPGTCFLDIVDFIGFSIDNFYFLELHLLVDGLKRRNDELPIVIRLVMKSISSDLDLFLI